MTIILHNKNQGRIDSFEIDASMAPKEGDVVSAFGDKYRVKGREFSLQRGTLKSPDRMSLKLKVIRCD